MIAERPLAGRPDEVEWDQKEMPFTEHLRELRNGLFVCVGRSSGSRLAMCRSRAGDPGLIRTISATPAERVRTGRRRVGDLQVRALQRDHPRVAGDPLSNVDVRRPGDPPKTRRAVYIYVAPSIFLALAASRSPISGDPRVDRTCTPSPRASPSRCSASSRRSTSCCCCSWRSQSSFRRRS